MEVEKPDLLLVCLFNNRLTVDYCLLKKTMVLKRELRDLYSISRLGSTETLRYISMYKYFIVPLFILFMNKGLFITIYDWRHKLVTYLPTILITLIESSKSNFKPTSINIVFLICTSNGFYHARNCPSGLVYMKYCLLQTRIRR